MSYHDTVRYSDAVWALQRALQDARKAVKKQWMSLGLFPSIDVSQAEKCVRTNSTARLVSPLTAFQSFQVKDLEAAEAIKDLQEVRAEFVKVCALMEKTLKICPECKGQQGGGDPLHGSGHTRHKDGLWWDCGRCNGSGIVPKSDPNKGPMK